MIGLILLWGFLINVILCTCFQDVFLTWNPTFVLIGYFIIAVCGICMSTFSDNPIISFAGYNLVVIPVGVVLSITLKDYYIDSIIYAFAITTCITIILIIIASIKPEIFESPGYILGISLTSVIIIEVIMMFVLSDTPKIWDIIVALLFCGYIGYDWAQAQSKDRTVDNAVDAAVDLYLDIINLFLRVLSSSSDKD